MMAGGSTALMLLLTVGVLHMPIGDFFAENPAETTSVITTGAHTTTESVTTEGTFTEASGKMYENFTYGGENIATLDGESVTTTEALMPISITVKRGVKTWRFDADEDVAEIVDFMLREDLGMSVTAEAASDSRMKKYTFILRYKSGDEVETQREYTDLEAFFERLKTKKRNENE